MKKQLIVLTLGLGLFSTAHAQQDQHFSMFAESPVFLNPAAAGQIKGDLQLFTNYRLQWTTVSDNPYRTITASTDWKMFDDGGSFMGAGLNFYNDVAGDGAYQTNSINIPVNYSLQVGEENYLSFGLQPGFYQRVLKNPDLTWDNQWNGSSFDQSINSGELLLNQNFNVTRFDIGAGVYWNARVKENAKIMLGISGHHLTRQRVNFTSEDVRLYRKLTFHGQGSFKRPNSNVTIMPAFAAFLQGPNKEVVVGSNYKFLLKSASLTTSYFDEVSLSLGTYFRIGDAILLNAILDMSGFSLGAAYDINVSRLTTASKGVGGMEFFLRYRIEFGNRNLRYNRVKED